MHTKETCRLTLTLLWRNYQRLDKEIRGEPKEPYDLNDLPTNNMEQRVSLWLCRQGFILSAWNLWEQYARDLIEGLSNEVKRDKSFPIWVADSFNANSKSFPKSDWFRDANGLRNLLVHFGARFDSDPNSQRYWTQTQAAFPGIEHSSENYVIIQHDHTALVMANIDEFLTSA